MATQHAPDRLAFHLRSRSTDDRPTRQSRIFTTADNREFSGEPSGALDLRAPYLCLQSPFAHSGNQFEDLVNNLDRAILRPFRKVDRIGMKSSTLLHLLLANPELFTKTIYEAPPPPPEHLQRAGTPRHYWRVRQTPFAVYHVGRNQWWLQGQKVNERRLRNIIVKGLIESRQDFAEADIALSLDILKALDRPAGRWATDLEIRRHQALLAKEEAIEANAA